MFSIDSRFYQVCILIYKMVILNLLFLLTSLPIITIGASFGALVKTIGDYEEEKTIAFYFQTFKINLLRTLPLLGFNLSSVLFYFSLKYSNYNGSSVLHLLTIVFGTFLLIYNINTYIVQAYFGYQGFYQLFQMSFYFTLSNIYKIFWIPFVWITIVILVYPKVSFLIFLVICSAPMFLYMKLVKKNLKST